MYARNYRSDNRADSPQADNYNIPPNYSGNAFIADSTPVGGTQDSHTAPVLGINNVSEADPAPDTSGSLDCTCHTEEKPVPRQIRGSSSSHGGIIHRMRARLEEGIKLDDLLLIGLILLLSEGGDGKCEKNNDDLILILALLFISGF